MMSTIVDGLEVSPMGDKVREHYDREAKERMTSGQNQYTKSLPVNLPEGRAKGDSRDKAGELVGVSGKTIG